jgi:hypothetical protein
MEESIMTSGLAPAGLAERLASGPVTLTPRLDNTDGLSPKETEHVIHHYLC